MRLRLLIVSSLVLSLPAAAAAAPPRPHVRCGTLERLPQALRAPRAPRIAALGGGEKQTRDGFGGGHQLLESANFAVKWTSADLTPEQAQQVIDILEESWSLYFDVLGHTPPPGADQFRINAYVSGEKDNPSIDFDGGYANIDGEGFTYLVLSSVLIGQEDDDSLLATASHEFYHDVQLGTNAYAGETAYWWWEATAEWASQELYPDLDESYAFVGAFALLPELPIFYAGDALADDDPGAVHQYGATIFPRHLTDRFEQPALVVDSWELGLPDDDPLDVVDNLLPSGTIAEAYAEFAPRMALWDFTRRDLILPWIDVYADAYPDSDAIALRVGPLGTAGMIDPAGRAPRAFGTNIVEIARPASGELDLAVEVDAAGSLGSAGQLTATVVVPGAGTADAEYTPVAITGGAGSARVSLDADQTTAYLVVAATADTRSLTETFSYRVSVAPVASEPEPDDGEQDDGDEGDDSPGDGEDGGGCGYGTGGAGDTGAAALLLAGLVLWRRRATARGR